MEAPPDTPGTAAPDARPRVAQLLARRARWRPAELVFWALAAAMPLVWPSRLLLLNEIAILALFALSLDLILGFAGIVSLGQAAFFGTGAFAAGLLAAHGLGDPLLGLAAGAAASALLGLATSALILRGADLTRLMVTLGVSLILGEAANQAVWLTGGADGLQGIAVAPILGLFAFDLFGRTAYLYSLAVLFACFVLARRLVAAPLGLSLMAIRDNPLRAAALGVPVKARLVGIYTLAAGVAGVAGALLAETTQFVSLDVFDFQRSADVLLVVVIGGAGTLYGAIAGAIVFRFAQDALSGLTPQYWHFWVGLLLVVVVLVGRERVLGLLVRRVAALPGRR